MRSVTARPSRRSFGAKAAVLVIAGALIFAGCGGSESAAPASSAGTMAKGVEILPGAAAGSAGSGNPTPISQPSCPAVVYESNRATTDEPTLTQGPIRLDGGKEPVAAIDPGGSPIVLGSEEILGNVATPPGPAVVASREQFEQRWQATVQSPLGNETLTDQRIEGPVCIEGGKTPSGPAVDTGSAPIVLGSSAMEAAVAPGTPTGVSAAPIAGATSIAVTWAALTSLGSGDIYGYVATASASLMNTSPVGTCFIQSASATSCTIEGLKPGTEYFVDVAAFNSVGNSPASSPRVKVITPTLLKAPGAPTAITAAPNATSASSIAVTWAAPTSDGGSPITGYTASASTAPTSTSPDGTCKTASASATSCVIEGLKPGTDYFVDVAATNPVGNSSASSPRVKATTPTLQRVPGAPTAVTAAPERSILSTTIKVSWGMPTGDGGSPITGYRASVIVGGSLIGSCLAGGSERSCLIQGLTVGTTYTDVQVAAINSVGTGGTGKMQGTVTTLNGSGFDGWGPPKPVSAVTLTLGTGQMTVSWKAPSSPLGITRYTATATPRPQKFKGRGASRSCDAKASESSCVITGLTKGSTYDVVVTYTAVHFSIAKTATMPPSAPVSAVVG